MMEIIIYIGFTIINLIILGLNVKLYTEYFKDRSMLHRKGGDAKCHVQKIKKRLY